MLKKVLFYIAHWETWHWLAKYIPLLPVWLWYCLIHRSFWFFTTSNPSLTFGGFFGEPKREMYEQLPCCCCPKSIYVSPSMDIATATKMMEANGLTYPVAVKPDIGMMGFMFRKIDSVKQLHRYHQVMRVDYIIQELVQYPLEVSVFYTRLPNQEKGTITGFLKKEFLQVSGDGKKTLLELILDYPRVRFRVDEMKVKHRNRLHEIIPDGEQVFLSYALNLSRGGKLVSLAHEKDERLLKVFDDLSNYAKHFYYGRYDIKCQSIEELRQGKNFCVLEFNGCGAEPHHIYGNGNSLFQACGILLHHWKILHRISKYNHDRGLPYWKFGEGLAFVKKTYSHIMKLRALDLKSDLEEEISPAKTKVTSGSIAKSIEMIDWTRAV